MMTRNPSRKLLEVFVLIIPQVIWIVVLLLLVVVCRPTKSRGKVKILKDIIFLYNIHEYSNTELEYNMNKLIMRLVRLRIQRISNTESTACQSACCPAFG